VLEVLREPLESGVITVSRAARQAEFPAHIQLIAAMNPCPCGYLGDAASRCRCTSDQVRRYRARISGPLLDRLDLHVEVPRIPAEQLRSDRGVAEQSAAVARRVSDARGLQIARQGKSNARLGNVEVDRFCAPNLQGRIVLERAMQRFALSARAYHRILKVSRSIADLEAAENLSVAHISEAIGLRRLDRQQKN